MKDYNIYEDYLLLNSKIQDNYSDFMEKFPVSFKTIEWYLRLYESVGIHEFEKTILKRKSRFEKYSLNLIRIFFNFFYSKNKKRALINIPRIYSIEYDTKEFLETNGITCNEFGKGYNIIDSLIGNSLFKLGLYDNMKNFPFNDSYDEKFWIKFEFDVNKLIIKYFRLFNKLNFKIVVTQDFHTDTGFLLSKIIKLLNVSCLEFAHAFTQDRHLVTVLPINGDYSIIWSEYLQSKISIVSTQEERSKLINFDYPNVYGNHIILGKKHFLLLFPGLQARTSIERKIIYKKWIDLYNYINSIDEIVNIVVRCHPGDLTFETNKIRSSHRSCISNKSLEFDLINSFFFIGGATTVLVDAFQNKIPCFQITDFDPENLILPIKRFSLEQFFNLNFNSFIDLKSWSYNYNGLKEFNYHKYFDFLNKRI